MSTHTHSQKKSWHTVVRDVASKLKKHPALYSFCFFVYSKLRWLLSIGKKNKAKYKITKKQRQKELATTFDKNIKFSILVPLYNTPKRFLIDMISSVQNQTYGGWQLCLADGSDEAHAYIGEYVASLNDNRISYVKLTENKGISENTNECIKMATGNYIALFDHDDLLHPSALFEMMKAICDKDADFVYTDEAVFMGKNPRNIKTCHFKPDFSYYNLLANNYICHFSAFKASLIDEVGMFRKKYDGSQDHDIILRLTSVAKNVVHIPKILYFWRSHANSVAMDIGSKTYAIKAGISAVHDFLADRGIETEVVNSPKSPTVYRVKYQLTSTPKISIIIPFYSDIKLLEGCIKSITEKSSYKNYEIIVVASKEAVSNNVFGASEKIRLLTCDNTNNYSALINAAAKSAEGEYLILLDGSAEIITDSWIEELLMYAQQNNIGAVGAKLLFANNQIQHGGIILTDENKITVNSHKNIGRDEVGYMGKMLYAQNIIAVSSDCLMVKKSVFDLIGGFDEGQTAAYCDVDFCLTLNNKGFKNIFNPFCELYILKDEKAFDKKIFAEETERFKSKWQDIIKAGDPYYNPNFSKSIGYRIDFLI